MNKKQALYYCGQPGIGFEQIIFALFPSKPPSWFEGKRFSLTHSARTGIARACELLGLGNGSEVLVPSYNCGSEIAPLLAYGVSLKMYNVLENGKIDIKDLESRISQDTKAIYLTYYFGFPQPTQEVANICKNKRIYLIEDCALSLFSKVGDREVGSFGDVAVFSLVKTLPVPDGGVLVINNPRLPDNRWCIKPPGLIRICRGLTPFLKLKLLTNLAQWHLLWLYGITQPLLKTQLSDAESGKVQSEPEIMPHMEFGARYKDKGISLLSRHMMSRFDKTAIIHKRRENFLLLLSLIKVSDICRPLFTELPEGVCPLNFPMIVSQRSRFASLLKHRFIDAGRWWKGYYPGLPWREFPNAQYLKDNLLVLRIHQELNQNQIRYMAGCFNSIYSQISNEPKIK